MILVDIVNAINDASDQIHKFLSDEVYQFLTKFVAWFVKWSVVAMWKIKLAVLKFAWDVAQEIITSLNISQYINAAWSSLNSQVLSMFVFFRVPEAVNIILSASVTKFVLRFIGF